MWNRKLLLSIPRGISKYGHAVEWEHFLQNRKETFGILNPLHNEEKGYLKNLITYRNVNRVSLIVAIAGFYSFIFSAFWFPLFVLGLVLFITGWCLRIKYWRCPFCGIGLPWRESNIRYCPSCGKKLDLWYLKRPPPGGLLCCQTTQKIFRKNIQKLLTKQGVYGIICHTRKEDTFTYSHLWRMEWRVNMRKLASVFLAVAMLWSCSFTAFAYTYSDIAGSPALVSDTDSLEHMRSIQNLTTSKCR